MIRYHDLCDKELLKTAVIQELRKLGYKNVQKIRKNSQKSDQGRHISCGSKLFHNELHLLASKIINLEHGYALEVPEFVADACSYIEENVSTEGIFRKAGSAARQREIKALLEEGNGISPEHHVIDVANILKLFFRELPEPLIPFNCHEMLVWCLQMKEKTTDCLLLACLLLPPDHLDLLIYFMQFLHRVADHAEMNKMDVNNLSIIMAPTLMPVEERKTENMSQNGHRLKNHVKVIELLIRTSQILGGVPRGLEKKLPLPTQNSRSCTRPSRPGRDEGSKKKRRSGSLTRVLSGLRKMVGKAPSPCKAQVVSSSQKSESSYSFGKKRKALESSVSFNRKKKRDDLQTFPSRFYLPKPSHLPFQQDILMPCNACGLCASPQVCYDPNISSPEVCQTKSCECEIENKQLMSGYPNVEKIQKMEEDENYASKLRNKGSKVQLNPVRRWSSMSSSRESKIRETSDMNSFPKRISEVKLLNEQNIEGNYNGGNFSEQRIKAEQCFVEGQELHTGSFLMANLEKEYEKIKNKVSAIENQLMEEFGRLGATVEGTICPVPSVASEDVKGLESVQTKYEKTLEEAERFSDSSADHLAKRLSRELKIRRSAEHKIIRSPSARKIGSIRRRSRDSFKQQKMSVGTDESLKSNIETAPAVQCLKQELLNASINSGNDSLYFQSSLKRGRPNTVRTGLRQPSPAPNSDLDSCSSRIQLTYVNVECFASNCVQASNDPQSVPQAKSQSLVELPSSLTNAQSTSEGGSLPAVWQSKLKQLKNFDFATPDVMKLKKSDKSCYSNATPMTPSQLRRASSFQESVESSGVKCSLSSHADFKKCASSGNVSQESASSHVTKMSSHAANHHWHSAASFLSDQNMAEQPVTGRESIAKLRAQNAGKVLANVKLFEHNGLNQDERVLSLCGPSHSDTRHNMNSCHKLAGHLGEETTRQLLCSSKASRLRRSSHGDKPSPKTSLSDSESPHKKHTHFKRRGRLSAPGPGKHSQKYRKCSSPVNLKKNLSAPMRWLEQSKENYMDSPDVFADNLIKSNGNLKDLMHDVFTPPSDKMQSIHASPLKDSNRLLPRKSSPYDNSPVDPQLNENVFAPTTGTRKLILQTPYTPSSPMIKQPLTSGHSSLRPVSRLRKKAGKPSPMRGIHKVFVEGTPKISPRRQSPRLLLRSRLMSNACM